MKDKLVQDFLTQHGLDIKIEAVLHGGVISSVWSATLIKEGMKMPVVIKVTGDRRAEGMQPPFHSRVDHFISGESQNLDVFFLKYLREQLWSETDMYFPDVIFHFPEVRITIQEDLRFHPDKFKLCSTMLHHPELNSYAASLGKGIGRLVSAFNRTKAQFVQVEESIAQFEERGLEALICFPNCQTYFREYLQRIVSSTSKRFQPVPTDIHPKNIFLGNNGRIAYIDFGRSVWGDADFALANSLSHFIINGIVGNIDLPMSISFVKEAIASYADILPFSEDVFVFYSAIEILHRSNGKFVDYLSENQDISKKIALSLLGQTLLVRKVCSVDDMFELMISIEEKVRDGVFELTPYRKQ